MSLQYCVKCLLGFSSGCLFDHYGAEKKGQRGTEKEGVTAGRYRVFRPDLGQRVVEAPRLDLVEPYEIAVVLVNMVPYQRFRML